MKKYVYLFEEGNRTMKEVLGGKGSNLAEMTNLGIPVPPGFTITTEGCAEYSNKMIWPDGFKEQIDDALCNLEKKIGKKLGDENDPLLVSVRSGAAVSMPGMMDTVLNLGLNDKSVLAISKPGNERFALDAYRRFINMFGDVVMGVEHKYFEEKLNEIKKQKSVKLDTELNAEDLKNLCEKYKEVVKKHAGKLFPEDPKEQLAMSINSVFNSWNNKRAIEYRKINKITGLLGTAVNIQIMVFGNKGEKSGTGVFFTRNPSTGDNEFYGEFLMNAQGEDVVAGIRTPKPISELKKASSDCYDELVEIYKKVEKHYKDMQDMEFTIEDGVLYILQTRTGKRTGKASVKIAVDMVKEGLITEEEAVMRIDPNHLDQLLHKQFDSKELERLKNEVFIANGLPASPGAAVGEVVFTADDAYIAAEDGRDVILVRTVTSPEDIKGMNAAKGILTSTGGMTSHAAVVARGMGKCCVAGCEDIIVNESAKQFTVGDLVVKEGEWISVNGSTGDVYNGKISTVDPELSDEFATLMDWSDKYRKIGVRTNADTPQDSEKARKFGAEGIGLCRTEHMFFEGERIVAVREMILSETLEERKKALEKLLPMQKEDFKGIYKAMSGLPVTIRLLDPPLHEFLPKTKEEFQEVSNDTGVSIEKLEEKAKTLHEFNPMLGHRGCRLAITYPEIAEMQIRAIFTAAKESIEEGYKPIPEIEVPLVGNIKEFTLIKNIVNKVAKEENIDKQKIPYKVGTMIEVPRACITADEIAKEAEFFSFGTNDLTQMTCGFSRDDAGKFLKEYIEKKIYAEDPFRSIDKDGVGELMKYCIEKARKVKSGLEIGICGEHGGEPESVKFCHRIGLNYVSCSPYRVPIARLAAAQAAIESKKDSL